MFTRNGKTFKMEKEKNKDTANMPRLKGVLLLPQFESSSKELLVDLGQQNDKRQESGQKRGTRGEARSRAAGREAAARDRDSRRANGLGRQRGARGWWQLRVRSRRPRDTRRAREGGSRTSTGRICAGSGSGNRRCTIRGA
jgi:hypothetical protein